MITTYQAMRITRLAKRLLEIESTDQLGNVLPGVTKWEKLSDGYRDHLKRKAKMILEATDSF